MVHISFDVNEAVLATLHQAPVEFTNELRLAAAAKWYEQHTVSQGRAAEIAGLSRVEFIGALGRFGVSPFQAGVDELIAEAGDD